MPGCHTLLLEIPTDMDMRCNSWQILSMIHILSWASLHLYLAQLPASSNTSATRYSRVAARYTAAFTITCDGCFIFFQREDLTLVAYRSFFSLLWTLETDKTSPAFFVLLTGFLSTLFCSFDLPLLVLIFFGSFPLPLLKESLRTALATAPAVGLSSDSTPGSSSTSSATRSSSASSCHSSAPSWLRSSALSYTKIKHNKHQPFLSTSGLLGESRMRVSGVWISRVLSFSARGCFTSFPGRTGRSSGFPLCIYFDGQQNL